MNLFCFKIKNSNKGFTLVELLVVLAITGILLVFTFYSLKSTNNTELVTQNTFQVLSLLDQARSETLSAKGDSQYGIHFTQSSATLFKGATYSVSDPNNSLFTFDSRVWISSISLQNGGWDVLFDRLTGSTESTDGYGTIIFSLKSNPSVTKIITVWNTGISESN